MNMNMHMIRVAVIHRSIIHHAYRALTMPARAPPLDPIFAATS